MNVDVHHKSGFVRLYLGPIIFCSAKHQVENAAGRG
ncbi:hypothetical protein CUZ56_00728 [Saezia sanguinis]|uniref:Uncharacterized protein n=1 Tax=Saezia sanguinis TaxID=1965230 RepID=A0A433SHM1_9BURK|nr:hypothetical protein CUZ56_00728 [Saezia sanguinis]